MMIEPPQWWSVGPCDGPESKPRLPAIQFMTTPRNTSVTLGQLEANFPLYCRALRMLVGEGMSLAKIK